MENFTYILGASSEIAKELIKVEINKGKSLCLFTRNKSILVGYLESLEGYSKDKIKIFEYNLLATQETFELLFSLKDKFYPNKFYVMVGYLGSKIEDNSKDEVEKIYEVNSNSLSRLFDLLLDRGYLSEIKTIFFSSSVGAELFYKRYFHYYESKRLLNKYLNNLKATMSYEQANVVSLMIGPVYDTRMGPSGGFFRLFASSKKSIAEEIGAERSYRGTVYIPAFWSLFVLFYRIFPSFIKNYLKKII